MLYNAFLSYSHAADGRLAPALQTGLQQFAKPWNRLRAIRVFRDKTGLSATPGLWTAIEAALDGSDYFVLLASPASAQSHWVQKEVEHWLTHRPKKNLLVTLTDGEIVWDAEAGDFDWQATTALPQLMRGRLSEEPLWVDMRWARKSDELTLRNPAFRDVVADLSSALRGIAKDQLTGEDVRQHRKAVRLRRASIAGLSVLALALALAAFVAVGQKTLAQRNAELARRNEQTASDNAARAQVNAKLAQENEETAKRNEQAANENADRAEKNRKQAEENLALARANEKRARENQRRAEENAAEARRQTEEARRQSERALARQLAAQSEFVREQRSELPRATLLAVESVRRFPSAETDQSLRNALDILPARSRQLELGGPISGAAFDQRGRTLFVHSETAAQVWDIESGKRLAAIESPERISAMARSRDGQRLALATHCVVTVYDAKTGRQLASAKLDQNDSRFKMPGCIEFKVMDISPDDRLVAAGGDAVVTRVWNTETGAVQDLWHARAAPASHVDSLEFSPDGKFLAGVRTDDVAVWATDDWKRTDLKDSPSMSYGERVAFSPGRSGKLAAVTGYGVAVWARGEERRQKAMTLPGNNFSRAVAVAFDGDPNKKIDYVGEPEMVAASVGEDAVVWDVSRSSTDLGVEVARMKHQGEIVSIAFSPDAKRVLTVSEDKTASVWEARGGKEVARFVHEAPLLAATFGADGKVWTVDASGVARAWEVSSGGSGTSVARGKPVSLSADGGLLAVAMDYSGGQMDVWDLRERTDSPVAKPKRSYLAVHGGPRQFLAASYAEGGTKVEDLAEGKQLLFVKESEISEDAGDASVKREQMRFSPDGRYLVGSSYMWEIASGRRLKLKDAGEESRITLLSPDSRLAAIWLANDLHVVETETGRELARFDLSSELFNDPRLAFSPDGRYLAKMNFPTHVWDLRASPRPVEVIAGGMEFEGEGFTSDSGYLIAKRPDDSIISIELTTRRTTVLEPDYANISMSPTAPLVAFAWRDSVRIVDQRNGSVVARLDHFGVSCDAVFSADGAYLATGGSDGLVRVWETAKWREVTRVNHASAISNILFSADDRYIVAEVVAHGATDGGNFVSALGSAAPARDACARVGRNLTPDEWKQHLENAPYRETCPPSQ